MLKRLWRAFCAAAASINLFPPLPDRGPLADYRRRLTVEEAQQADADKLRGDWQRVGNDLRRTMAQWETENGRPATDRRPPAVRVRQRRGR